MNMQKKDELSREMLLKIVKRSQRESLEKSRLLRETEMKLGTLELINSAHQLDVTVLRERNVKLNDGLNFTIDIIGQFTKAGIPLTQLVGAEKAQELIDIAKMLIDEVDRMKADQRAEQGGEKVEMTLDEIIQHDFNVMSQPGFWNEMAQEDI